MVVISRVGSRIDWSTTSSPREVEKDEPDARRIRCAFRQSCAFRYCCSARSTTDVPSAKLRLGAGPMLFRSTVWPSLFLPILASEGGKLIVGRRARFLALRRGFVESSNFAGGRPNLTRAFPRSEQREGVCEVSRDCRRCKIDQHFCGSIDVDQKPSESRNQNRLLFQGHGQAGKSLPHSGQTASRSALNICAGTAMTTGISDILGGSKRRSSSSRNHVAGKHYNFVRMASTRTVDHDKGFSQCIAASPRRPAAVPYFAPSPACPLASPLPPWATSRDINSASVAQPVAKAEMN